MESHSSISETAIASFEDIRRTRDKPSSELRAFEEYTTSSSDSTVFDSVPGVKVEAVGDSLVPRTGVTKGSLSCGSDISKRLLMGNGLDSTADESENCSHRLELTVLSSASRAVKCASRGIPVFRAEAPDARAEQGLKICSLGCVILILWRQPCQSRL